MPGSPAGTPTSYALNRGQYLQISQDVELTGSPIVADAPIAVIGGSTLLDVPISCTQRADGAEQMLPPVSALGSEYVAVRYRSRPVNGAGYDSGTWWGEDGGDAGVVETSDGGFEEVVPWRVVGAVDGTILTYDPAPPSGAPLSLNAKQLVEFDATGPFVVRSQDSAHPFYFASYMTGGEPFDGDGDPEFVNVVPPAQFLPRYTFFTDPTYPETNLVDRACTRRNDGPHAGRNARLRRAPRRLDAGGLGGAIPVHAPRSVDRRFRRDKTVATTAYTRLSGRFAADAGSSTPAFGVTVWGWGNDITLAQDTRRTRCRPVGSATGIRRGQTSRG